jgi:hypothetical protein
LCRTAGTTATAAIDPTDRRQCAGLRVPQASHSLFA